jgi:hypothetical protein
LSYSVNTSGIQLLINYPDDFPSFIRPCLIPSEALVDMPKFMDHLKPKNKVWWEKWLKEQPLPPIIIPEGNSKNEIIN